MNSHKDIVYQMIKEERLIPFYQKIVDLNTAKISYEILVRGENNGEVVSPFFFLEQAKELKLLNRITEIVIDKSFSIFSNSATNFSINITEEDFKNNNFISLLVDKAKQYNVRPNQITLEILEDILIDDSVEHRIIIDKIRELRELGFKFALDDFGTRNSNFDRLVFIEVDIIKFDKIFLKDIHEHEFKSLMLKNLIGVVKNMNIKTVFEGIETKEDLIFSKENKIDLVQGFFIGRPEKNIILTP